MSIQELLEKVYEKNASDLHLVVGALPTLRLDGELRPLEGTSPLSGQDTERLCLEILSDEQKDLLLSNKEIDLSFSLGEIARFRVNVYYQKGFLAAAFRHIPAKIRRIEELNLPSILHRFTRLPQGFVLVTGPTGCGKSTTLAALINEVNENRACHIVTIEDPIEYVYPHRRSLVTQRELHLDTHSWEIALRSCLREDPDVVLIGEMRDYDTIAAAMTIAETGHLVFSTLHTNSAAQTVDRIIDVFPEHKQAQIRTQLASVLEGVASQRILPAIGGGLVPATELLLATPAVRSLIRDDKAYQIDNLIVTSRELGMHSLEYSLAGLVKGGLITFQQAQSITLRPEELSRLLRAKEREEVISEEKK